MLTRTLLAAALLVSITAHADVSITMQTAGKASFINVGGEGVTLIKGKRQRNDQMIGKRMVSSIIDVEGLRFVTLDEKKKSALVTPLGVIGEELAAVGVGSMQATLTKTAQTKQIAGYPCTVHDLRVTVPFSPTGQAGDGMDLTLVMSGNVCLSTQVPGLGDYQAFYKAAADSGFIFGDPRAANSPTGAAQAKAYAELTRKMAEAGMALETHLVIAASGDNPLAGIMGKLAASDVSTTVVNITSGELPPEQFEIPAGYKVKEQKK